MNMRIITSKTFMHYWSHTKKNKHLRSGIRTPKLLQLLRAQKGDVSLCWIGKNRTSQRHFGYEFPDV